MAKFAAGDIAGAAALYSEDARFKAPHMEALNGRDAIQVFLQGAHDAGIAAIELTTSEVEGDGSNAIEHGRYQMKTADGTVADSGEFMVHWKQQDGDWKLHRDMICTDMPAPEA